MGFKLTELYAELTGKDAGFKAAISSAKTLSESASGAMQGMSGRASALITHLAGAAAGIISVHKAIEAFAERETAINNLAAAFRLAGNESKFAVGQAREFADGIMAVTTHSDEAVLAAMRAGSAIAHLSGEGLEQATHAAVGLAAALGIDLERAMMLIIKAKAGNTTALKRLGVELDASMTKQEKYAAVLKIGEEGFALATAQADTLIGSWQQLKNATSELAADFFSLFSWTTKVIKGWDILINKARELTGLIDKKGPQFNKEAIEEFSKRPLEKQIMEASSLQKTLHSGNPTKGTWDTVDEMWANLGEMNKIIDAEIAEKKRAAKEKEAADAKAATKAEEAAAKVADFERDIATDMLGDEAKKRAAVDETARKRIENAEKLYKTDEDLSYALLAIEEARQRGMDKLAADALEKRREARDKEREEDAKAAESRAGDMKKANEKVAGAAERLAGLKADHARPQVFTGGGDLSRRIQEGVGSEQKKAIVLAEKQLEEARELKKQQTRTNELLDLIQKAGQPFTWV